MPTDPAGLLADIRRQHFRIEAALQALGRHLAHGTCATCTSVCCREVMCRESIDSDFLRFLLGERSGDYDPDRGWLAAGQGCTLARGRPLVCYEFFCERFDRAGVAGLRDLARRFKTAYARVQGGRHILEVEDIHTIAPGKLARVLARLEQLAADAEALQAPVASRVPPPATSTATPSPAIMRRTR